METTRDLVIKVQAQAEVISADLANLHAKLEKIEARTRSVEFKIAIGIGIILTIQAANFFGVLDRYKPTNQPHEKISFNH